LFNLWNPWTYSNARRQGKKDARRKPPYPHEDRPELGFHSDVVNAANQTTSKLGEDWKKEDAPLLDAIRSRCIRTEESKLRRDHIEKEMEGKPYRQPHGKVGLWMLYGLIVIVEGVFTKSAIERLNMTNFVTWAFTFAGTILILSLCHGGGHRLKLHQPSRQDWIGTAVLLAAACVVGIGIAYLRCIGKHGFESGKFPIWLAYQWALETLATYFGYLLTDPLHDARQKQIKTQTAHEQTVVCRKKRHEHYLARANSINQQATLLGGCYESENNRWRTPLVFVHHPPILPASLTEFNEDEWKQEISATGAPQ